VLDVVGLGPDARRRTFEWVPSAPTTRSKMRGAACSNVTCASFAVSVSEVIESPKRYSQPRCARTAASRVAAADLQVAAGELARGSR